MPWWAGSMIQTLSVEILRFRQSFLGQIRAFFDSRGYLEVQTPALNPTGAVEPFIDSFQVHATGDRKSPAGPSRGTEGYLITSPEYNLKTVLAASPLPIYEICHSFRAGDVGAEHTEEFLMLEWYRPGATESDLILETNSLLVHLSRSFPLPTGLRLPEKPRTLAVGDLFAQAGIGGLGRDVLERAAVDMKLGSKADRYDELFFSLFLNRIEPLLRIPEPVYLNGYPEELAALSNTERGLAKRFELYWNGLELANGYEELRNKEEHLRRFKEFNDIRRKTGRPEMKGDPQFLENIEKMPECSGIALGVERLMMVFLQENNIANVSPFAWPK